MEKLYKDVKQLYVALFEELYKTAHKDNFYDYKRICDNPLQEIKEFFENKFNETL